MRRTNIFGEVERNEEEHTKTHQYASLAIGAFAALATLTIVLITQKLYNYIIITILLILMLLVLISGFYGKSIYKIQSGYFEKRRYNKLAKSNFEDFKKLVIRFKEFTKNYADNVNTIQAVMHNIKNFRPPHAEGIPPNPFTQINIIEPTFIRERYKFYNKRLDHFDGTIDSLRALAEEFESILNMYDMLYIKEPIKGIKNVVGSKVPPQYKESYNNAKQRYIDFIMDYQKFAKVANENYKKKEDSDFGEWYIFRDNFDLPEEL